MAKIIKSHKQLPLLSADSETVLPVLPLRSAIIFPGEVRTIQMGRRENLDLLRKVSKTDKLLVLSFAQHRMKKEGQVALHKVGVVARIVSVTPSLANTRMVTLEGLRRIVLVKVKSSDPYLTVAVSELENRPESKERLPELMSEIMELITRLIKYDNRYSNELVYNLEMNKSIPGNFADTVASLIHFQLTDKQEVLETVPVEERLNAVARLLNGEIDKISLSVQINDRVNESLERKKRESFLRQQLMEIRRELGEEFIEEDISKLYQNRIKDNKQLPREVANRLNFEAGRLKHLSSSSTEYGSTKNYLDLVLSLPWESTPSVDYDLVKVEEIIERQYYGVKDIKEQVLEYLAVRQTSREVENLPILSLAGAVGTGKASLVKAIANATGRKLVRINGASIMSVDDIKGTPRAEFGSGPGQIVQAIKQAGTFDLVIYFEDLEYVIESEDSNALLALLEAVDPRQNRRFIDHYVDIPLDFAQIFFVLGTSYMDEFPEPFSHRLEMVEMPGYIEREKITIVKKYILPKLRKRHGLTPGELRFSEKSLTRIIRQYTMEAGLLGLQQQLEKIYRKVARVKASCEECRVSINYDNVEDFLGTRQYIPEKATTRPEIGVATGLAWTGAGGDLMLIEALKMKGTGQVMYTGSLGEIMKESIQAAHSFVRARADMLGIDHNDFVNYDIHIHFPMGAIPKDGPSAGVTVSLVVASVMAERPIRNDIAMTGEVTLRGKVLSVGGIKEKISAAYRAGIYTVIMPKENEKDIKNIPKEILNKVELIYIETVDELFELCLMEFTPSTFTLEKIFAEEIERVKSQGDDDGGEEDEFGFGEDYPDEPAPPRKRRKSAKRGKRARPKMH